MAILAKGVDRTSHVGLREVFRSGLMRITMRATEFGFDRTKDRTKDRKMILERADDEEQYEQKRKTTKSVVNCQIFIGQYISVPSSAPRVYHDRVVRV
ncbi:hypothetical protein MMC12_006061 [Toensbergia leucococca]|nr:hypothetical protein [Toensbergia leucococca]